MNKTYVALLAGVALFATPVLAQNTSTNTNDSTSGAAANAGSVSGSSSDNNNVNAQVGNIGVSENTNTSNSSSGAISGSQSESVSLSNSDQNQGQDQGQSQGQYQEQGQANQQGVTFNQNFEASEQRKTTKVFTNPGVQVTSSSSFSSDYCGGTVSGGATAAPIGISIGGAAPKYDKSCQSLRRAEKFGMAAVNAQNLHQPELAQRLMSMMIWSICTADSGGPDETRSTAQACMQLALLGSGASAQPLPAPAPEPTVTDRNGNVTPVAAYKSEQEKVALAQSTTGQ
jgi:hypothetical protein